MSKRLAFPALTLGLASFFYTSRDRDWSDFYSEATGEPGYQTVLPAVTLADVDQRAADLFEDFPEEAARLKTDPGAEASEELADAFLQSDGYDEFRDSFDPMMNFGWPVFMGMDVDPREAAARMREFAPSCVLIELQDQEIDVSDSYEIALTGGGMNLADHLFAAYLCCGQVPPLKLLEDLSGCLPSYILPRLPVVEVYERAAEVMARKMAELDRQCGRIVNSAAEEARKEAERAENA